MHPHRGPTGLHGFSSGMGRNSQASKKRSKAFGVITEGLKNGSRNERRFLDKLMGIDIKKGSNWHVRVQLLRDNPRVHQKFETQIAAIVKSFEDEKEDRRLLRGLLGGT